MWNKEDGHDVDKAWAILRAGSSDSSGLEMATLPARVSTADGAVRFALGRNGEARLLLPLSDGESGKAVTGAAALQIMVSTYTQGRKLQRFLDLTCQAKELERVFTELGDEILSRVASGAGCEEAARSTIEEFRSLLVRPNSTQSSLSQVAGLVGELIFLNRLLDRDPTAWKSWRGPAGDRHDFACESNSLEVKTTLSKGRSEISVNGFNQLERPAGGSLYLLHFELEAVGAGMFSVEALGGAALGKANKPENLQQLLSALGCEDVRDPSWNHTTFRLEAESLFCIADGFPRLVPSMLAASSLPAGVSNVSYTTDLSTAEEFRMESSETAKIEELFL